MKEYQRLKGTKDILADESKIWQYIEDTAVNIFESYGYSRIRTPIIEYLDLFERSLGQATDIVQKEMYHFTDRAGRIIALRPEATAGVARAYIENNLAVNGLNRLYYIGAMFRGENPQAGRYRQFHQIGVEAIGSNNPYLDAEILILINALLDRINLKNFEIIVNNIGCNDDRSKYSGILKNDLKKHLNILCPNCRNRLDINPLRILDCKNPDCKNLLKSVPKISDYACVECRKHFSQIQTVLETLNIRFTIDHNLVRGLDYYTKTVFEVIHKDLGAQNALCAGGRYDNLIQELGGQPTGACGFALGLERLAMAVSETISLTPSKETAKIYIATLGDTAIFEGIKTWHALQLDGIKTAINYEQKSLKAQLREANKLNTNYVIIIGEDEIKNNIAIIKDMQKKTQENISFADIISCLKEKLK